MAQDRLHVVPHGDGWAVKWEGNHAAESTHATQKEAIEAGRGLAQEREADMVVHRSDGTFRKVYTIVGDEDMSNRINGKDADTGDRGRRLATSDMLSVGTRVSWGAIMAGTAVTLTSIIMMGMLATAAGLTLRDRMSDQSYYVSAMICSIVMMLASLFLGGLVVSRLTAGEDKTEAVTYGVILWGALFVSLALLTATGANIGHNALGMRNEAQSALPGDFFANMRTPLNEEQMSELRTRYQTSAPTISPTKAAWWTFATILLSLGAAIAGSITGAGPTLFLRQIRERRIVATTVPATQSQSQMQTSNR